MAIRTSDEVLTIAKASRSIEPDEPYDLPEAYINVIGSFLEKYPYDDSFIIEPATGDTAGVVTCMESKCWTDISLQFDHSIADGGRSNQIGSLDEFIKHINNHPTHKKDRDERQKDRIAADARAGRKRAAEEPKVDENTAKKARTETPTIASPAPAASSSSNGVGSSSQASAHSPAPPPSRPLNPEEKKALAKAEYEFLKRYLLATKVSSNKKKISARMTVLAPTMMGGAVPKANRALDLSLLFPELEEKFGSFDRPPAQFLTSAAPPSSSAPAPSAAVTAAGPVAGPGPGSMSYLDRIKAQADLQRDRSGVGAVLDAVGGPSDPFASLSRAGFTSDGPAYGSAEYLKSRFGDLSDDEDGPGGYMKKPVLNGREMELKEFFEASLNDFANNDSVNEALANLGLAALDDCLPGMKISLMAHQVIGVAWLVKQESKPNYCGGILADAMGLGKTIQATALMVINQSRDPKKKSNLIVAPLALLEQWKDEIEGKCVDDELSVYIYHGPGKNSMTRKKLRAYDVVLTTYGTLVTEFPKPEKKKKKKRAAPVDGIESDESDHEAAKPVQKWGPLAQIEWYRIILDEAQNIRNKNTRVSTCISEMEADYRWSLTGTPITNGVEDLFGQFRFLRTPKFYDWEEFNNHIGKPAKKYPDRAAKRAQVVLQGCLIRRTKDSLIDGQPILTLPAKDIEVQEMEFTAQEREIYSAIESKARVRFNKFLKAGTVLKNYACVLTMLLRLRQLCNHPQLLARAKSEGIAPNDLLLQAEDEDPEAAARNAENAEMAKLTEIERAIKMQGQIWVDKVKEKFKTRIAEAAAAESRGDEEYSLEAFNCPICFEPLSEGRITTCCMQEFCKLCLDDLKPADSDNDHAADEHIKSCPTCRAKIDVRKTFESDAFAPAEEAENTGSVIPGASITDLDLVKQDEKMDEKPNVKPEIKGEEDSEDEDMPDASMIGKGKGRMTKRAVLDSDEEEEFTPARSLLRSRAKVESDDSDDEFKPPAKKAESESENEVETAPIATRRKGKGRQTLEDADDIENIENSAKLSQMLALIEQWQESAPDDKIIIFSQWTSFIDLIGVVLKRSGHRFLEYTGDMSRTARAANVRNFMKNEKTKILVISLKCGGVGLNLTRANRVINMDLAWNTATEEQALDRVHRIGQTKAVVVKRLVVADSVEQRILALQERKKMMADASLGEGSGQKIGRMSVQDLAQLFGVAPRGGD